jgi:hypothetical protein
MSEQLLDLLITLLIIYMIVCLVIIAAVTIIGAWLTIPKYFREWRGRSKE